ncbi:MAG: amidohydrolase family protein [Flavobacteriaceae bacterium]|nr:amidohydrolase family protein [Flavobacteriaceae bacterium]
MNFLIKAAHILDPSSPFHNTQQDIYVQDGIIQEIGKNLSITNATVLKFDELYVSQGWFDSSVSFGEPGYEERETVEHGLKVAGLSGFTHVAYNTNTFPKPDSRADIAFLLEQAAGFVVALHPKACITTSNNEKTLAPLRELAASGAVSFSNHKAPICNANTLKLALQYCSDFDGLVESFPYNSDLADGGQMHEGAVSTVMGLNGIPSIVEEIQLKRDLGLLGYTSGKLHVPTISTAQAVQLIKEAKNASMDVSTSVSIHNLFFTDEALKGFNPNAKLLPPLREEADVEALRTGLVNGTIDMVTSDHQPLNSELKDIELDRAAFGSLAIEHTFGALLKIFPIEDVVSFLTRGKTRFGIPAKNIEIGVQADLTLFTPKGTKTITKESILSTSKNSLYIGEALPGNVYGVLAQGKALLQKV